MSKFIGFFRLIKDSEEKKSWTLTLAIPACIALTLSYLASGVEVTWAGHSIKIAKTSGSDYAMTVGVWLTFLAQRDWIKAKKRDGGGEPNGPGA